LKNEYVGSADEMLETLIKLAIHPETFGGRAVCSIGFSTAEQKWYGWSHRAMCGFEIGDKIENDNHVCTSSGYTDDYLERHPEKDYRLPVGFEAKTMDDAKRMAMAFADAVG